MPSFRRCLALALFALPFAAHADVQQEYDQVRRIALRDPKVQDAFARAQERLDDKIVALDPALAGYVRSHRGSTGAAERPSAPKPKPFLKTGSAATHTVAAGETLSSIAAQFHISSDSLQAANRIRDARKLKVGQVLTIPDGH